MEHGNAATLWLLCRVRVGTPKLVHAQPAAFCHALLGLTGPHAWIIELLVGGVSALMRIANLCLKVVVVLLNELADAIPIRPLSISIDIHLDHPGLNGGVNFLISRPTSSVHNKEDGLVGITFSTKLGLNVLLMFCEALGG